MTRPAEDEGKTIWDRCKKCVDQMMGGPRCYEHNPTPEMRIERNLPYVRQHVAPTPPKNSRKRK